MNLIFCKHNILHRVLKLIVRVTEKKIMRLNITTKDKSIMYPIKEQTLCQKKSFEAWKKSKNERSLNFTYFFFISASVALLVSFRIS